MLSGPSFFPCSSISTISSPSLPLHYTQVMSENHDKFPFPRPKLLSHQVVLLSAIALTSFLFISFVIQPRHIVSYTSTSTTWLTHFQANPYTRRIACREYDAGAQSCVFEGLACINTSTHLSFSRPTVYILHNSKTDFQQLPSDNWCGMRYQSSDPRYFASRHWPIKNDTVAPQRSCLDAQYRTLPSLNLQQNNVTWLPNIWLIDLDYTKNNHNNHLLKDILWILDVTLWYRSLHIQAPDRPFFKPLFDTTNRSLYLPQGLTDFTAQTSRDVNRLIYALVLQLDPAKLYPNYTRTQLRSAPTTPRLTVPLLEAYPHLRQQLSFHRDVRDDNNTDLVCTPRLTVGAKIGNGAHERVCRHLRQTTYRAFGIPNPVNRRLGRIYYPQPPKRIVILQRHISRKLANLEQVETALRTAFAEYDVAVEVADTRAIETAEAQVRLFSRVGVLISPHGSQNMGQIFMPRYSSLIEIMPVGYTDYAFNLLADSCKIWYYELQGVVGSGKKDVLLKECRQKTPHMMNPCTSVKYMDVWVDVPKLVETVRFALERMGYVAGKWLED